ncbi:MAG: pyridoxamine 5'-phosphate oxidase family protein [Proteobacteria bacterium]|nr:pyridoxamine 5'-phosphate oxidase family protein [Pseudomonadota bacterium]
MPAITSIGQLRGLYNEPGERALKKQLARLDRHCRSYIALSPYVVLCTADAAGNLDASPRGGSPGFCKVADDHTLLMPDRPGNNRLDSFSNIIATGRIGLLFFVPGVDEMLRVNGTAELRTDEGLCAQCVEQGKAPRVVVAVTVREAYLHCAKAIMRAGLWKAEAQVPRSVLPTMGEMIRDQSGGATAVEPQEVMVARYREQLY